MLINQFGTGNNKNYSTVLPVIYFAYQTLIPHLDGLVTVGIVVDDGERLLEAHTPYADDVSNQLTDSNYHLGEYQQVKRTLHLRLPV